MSWSAAGQILLGAACSFGAHYLGHVAYMSAAGIEWEQHGTREVMEYGTPSDQVAWAGRAGFLGQLLVGTAINLFSWADTPFGLGYDTATAHEIIFYPSAHCAERHSDLTSIDRSGDRDIEYFIYAGWSAILLAK